MDSRSFVESTELRGEFSIEISYTIRPALTRQSDTSAKPLRMQHSGNEVEVSRPA
jgi:hypothetical protein